MNAILKEISSSEKPVIRIIRKTENFKILAIGLDKDVELKKHKAPGRTKLLMLQGSIRYVTTDKEMIFNKFDEYEIPLEELHEVRGIEKSVFLLIVG